MLEHCKRLLKGLERELPMGKNPFYINFATTRNATIWHTLRWPWVTVQALGSTQCKVYPTLALCRGFVRWEACCRWIWVCSAVWKLPHVTYIMILMVLVPLLSSPCLLAASLFGLLTPLIGLPVLQASKLDPPWYPCQDFPIKLNHIKPLPLLLQSSPPASKFFDGGLKAFPLAARRGSTCHWTALWSSRNSPGAPSKSHCWSSVSMDWFKGKFTGNHGFYH